METMAKSALSQVSQLVDEDSAEIKMELSRLLSANSALTDKINSLECELTEAKSDSSKLIRACRSVGIQTDCYREEDVNCGIRALLRHCLYLYCGITFRNSANYFFLPFRILRQILSMLL